ncbi:DUF4398 domain-containing protein [Paucibacter sp. DJ2R-2]|uniref:DUF4398 domain-containing protein n=1 Tax=Paucibacter sp. DJ2R-2 TaxID=2893558 RepID=UPI0021E4E282|nr:DUF4398 domain-containing protein [Paucibacter sp. DJ2R-2]MCV2422248.1 DUF4398 domain-containing protein [Paucibacter sp. DJ4R-1]MCV2440168.1 DUF4398 domain-containing protein [Paucibacter sp. DJ2R-2]
MLKFHARPDSLPGSIGRAAAPARGAPRSPLFAVTLSLALLGASLLGACASMPPPTEQMAVSAAALNSATAAGGVQWAPQDMRSAQDKLDRARLAMNDKDYERALWLAQDAQANAQLAEKKAGAGKARKAAEELAESSRVLSEELSRKRP